jgi:hypothetical protein
MPVLFIAHFHFTQVGIMLDVLMFYLDIFLKELK